MRNLTVSRKFGFFGSLQKDYIYCSDEKHGDRIINGTKCRLIGEIHNGQKATFNIPSEQITIFISHKIKKSSYEVEYVTFTEGEEDVSVEGKRYFNPVFCHPFRFLSINEEELKQFRFKKTVVGSLVLILAVLFGIGIGFIPYYYNKINEAKYINSMFSDERFTVKLDSRFHKEVNETNTRFVSDHCCLIVSSESFEKFDNLGYKRMDATGYAEMLLNVTSIQSEINYYENITYFEYTIEEDDDVYYYISFVFLGSDSYWTTSFYTLASERDQYRDFIFSHAITFKFQ